MEMKQSGGLDGSPFRGNGFAIVGTSLQINIGHIHRSHKKLPDPRCGGSCSMGVGGRQGVTLQRVV